MKRFQTQHSSITLNSDTGDVFCNTALYKFLPHIDVLLLLQPIMWTTPIHFAEWLLGSCSDSGKACCKVVWLLPQYQHSVENLNDRVRTGLGLVSGFPCSFLFSFFFSFHDAGPCW